HSQIRLTGPTTSPDDDIGVHRDALSLNARVGRGAGSGEPRSHDRRLPFRQRAAQQPPSSPDQLPRKRPSGRLIAQIIGFSPESGFVSIELDGYPRSGHPAHASPLLDI